MKIKLNSFIAVAIIAALILAPQALLAWPFNTNVSPYTGYVYISPIIGDTDGDGVLEVFVVDQMQRLYCLTPNGDVKWVFNLYDPSEGPAALTPLMPTPLLVDLDDDPTTLEIVAATNRHPNPGRLYIIKDVGTAGVEMTRFNTIGNIIESMYVSDADHDGIKEIYFPISSRLYALNVMNNSGTISLTQKWVTNQTGNGFTSPSVVNVAGDEKEEIILGSGNGLIYGFNSQGQLLWAGPTASYDSASDVVVADLDNDGVMEAILRDREGEIECVNASNGTLKWRRTQTYQENGPANTPSVIDVNNDGKLEIIYGQRAGLSVHPEISFLECITFDGQLCPNWDRTPLPGLFVRSSVAAVKNPDDNSIKFYIGGTGYGITAFDSNGTKLWSGGSLPHVSFHVDVAAADLDQDGRAELCYGAFLGNFECIKDDGSSFQYTSPGDFPFDSKPWAQVHKNNQNTRVYELPEPITYTLNVNIVGEGTVTVEPNLPEYEENQVVQLTVKPARKWRFDYWSGDLSGNQNPVVQITMDGNKTVTAHFVPRIPQAGQVRMVEAN